MIRNDNKYQMKQLSRPFNPVFDYAYSRELDAVESNFQSDNGAFPSVSSISLRHSIVGMLLKRNLN